MTLSLSDYRLDPPDDPSCRCGAEDCDECERREEDEAAYDRYWDQKIDEWKERER